LKFLLGDHLGSTSVTALANGAFDTETRYYPWGGVRWASGTTPTDYRFTGQMEIATIGLYFYNSRFYDPSIGRFISPDSIIPNPGDPVSFDRFAYVRNSPLKYIDPSGHKEYCGSQGSQYDPEDCAGIPLLPINPPEGLSDDGNEAFIGLSNLNAIAIANGITMDAEDWLAFVIATEFLGAIGPDRDVIEAVTRRYHQYCNGGVWSTSCINNFWGYMEAFHNGGAIDRFRDWVISPPTGKYIDGWIIALSIAHAIRHPGEMNNYGITRSMNECYGYRCDWVTIDTRNGLDEDSLYYYIKHLYERDHTGWLIYPEGEGYFLVLTVSQIDYLCPGQGITCNLTGVMIGP
jgi:RHS repeat-associated protein